MQYPKPVLDLLASLASKSDPIALAEIPEPMHDPAVVRFARRNRLVQAVVWYEGSPGWSEPGLIVVPSPAGWVFPDRNDMRPLHLSITQTGRDVLDEARLAELAGRKTAQATKGATRRGKRRTANPNPTVDMMKAFTLWQAGSDYRRIGETLGVSHATAGRWIKRVQRFEKAKSVRAKAIGAPDRRM